MKYLKTYENIEKRQGFFVHVDNINHFIKYLQDKEVRFTVLYGKFDYEENDEKYFLILIEGNFYGKLLYDHDKRNTQFFDFYVEDEKGEKIYLNWFDLNELREEGNWEFIQNLEDINLYITSRKYNL